MGSVRTMLAGLLAVLFLTTVPPVAHAREVSGEIKLAMDHTDAEMLTGCLVERFGDAAQGVYGWMLPVTPGARWDLWSTTPSTTAGPVTNDPSFYISFWSKPPTCTDPFGDRSYHDGIVPANATVAIVTLAYYHEWLQVPIGGPGRPQTCLTRLQCRTGGLIPATFVYAEEDRVEPPRPRLHVAGIDMTAQTRGKANVSVSTVVSIVDATGAPYSGATVDLTVTAPDGRSYPGAAVSDAQGRATFSVEQKGGTKGRWEACVSSVGATEAAYEPMANSETCDSVQVGQ